MSDYEFRVKKQIRGVIYECLTMLDRMENFPKSVDRLDLSRELHESVRFLDLELFRWHESWPSEDVNKVG